MNTMKSAKRRRKIPMKTPRKSSVKSAKLNTKKFKTYHRCSHKCTTCARIGCDNRDTSNTWSKPVFCGTSSPVVTLTGSTRGYASSKSLKRKCGMKKNRGRPKRGIRTRSCSNSRCVSGKSRRKSSIRCIKLKWNRKIRMMNHRSFLLLQVKLGIVEASQTPIRSIPRALLWKAP